MLNGLKKHPFAVEAFFDRSLVVTYAVPQAQLQGLIPEKLTLDIFQDQWAFIAVAMVQTRGLRPKGFPAFLGNDFFLIGYRIFVRYRNLAGRNLRGLYILKSETNKRKMQVMGNLFTHYQYTTTDINMDHHGPLETIHSKQSDFEVTIDHQADPVSLPPDSPFASWKEARRFAGPMPFTYTYNPARKTMTIIEGVRTNWKPEPVQLHHSRVAWLGELGVKDPVLASAFQVQKVPYYWKKGKLEVWT